MFRTVFAHSVVLVPDVYENGQRGCAGFCCAAFAFVQRNSRFSRLVQ